VVVGTKGIRVTLSSVNTDITPAETINIPWTPKKLNNSNLAPSREPDQKLLQSIVRAHAWLSDLVNDRCAAVEELASKADIHPKVMREALKMAFLAPDIVTSIFAGEAPFELADLRKVSALSWQSQRKELDRTRSPQHSN
jgi:site-specific DNA recombinase